MVDYLDAWERPDTSVIGVAGTFSRMSAQSHPGVCHMVRSHRVRANLAGVGAAQHCRPSVSGAGTRQHFDRATAASSVPREAGTWPWKPCPVYEQLENFLKISLNYSPKKHILCAKKNDSEYQQQGFFRALPPAATSAIPCLSGQGRGRGELCTAPTLRQSKGGAKRGRR